MLYWDCNRFETRFGSLKGGKLVKTILISVLAGVGTAIAGIVFAAIFGNWFNGFSLESATILGMLIFLCIVIVTCTGIIITKVDKK